MTALYATDNARTVVEKIFILDFIEFLNRIFDLVFVILLQIPNQISDSEVYYNNLETAKLMF